MGSKRQTRQFTCQECGASHSKWSGKCASCGAWNTLIEEEVSQTEIKSVSKAAKLKTTKASQRARISTKARLTTGISEVDQVLGGGIMPGSIILLAGEPGVGKSTLLLQLAAACAKRKKVLYVSGEESMGQMHHRVQRLGVKDDNLELATTTSTDSIASTISAGDYDLVIVDSVQTMACDELSSSSGTVSQITNSARMLQVVAKEANTAVLLVGHVTKQGNIAGPKILEHLVDVVLNLEGERFGSFKILRGNKNRFGSTFEVGIFEMKDSGMEPVKNPSAALLNERQVSDGSVVFAAIEGTRALLVEVQALVNRSQFGYPKRTAAGFDLNRLNLLTAVLSRRAGLSLDDQDVYVNVVGGMKVAEPAADLAVCLAIVSALKNKPLKTNAVVFGEVGLSGEIRSVPQVDARVSEAKKIGFKAAIGPSSGSKNSFIKPVRHLNDVTSKILQ